MTSITGITFSGRLQNKEPLFSYRARKAKAQIRYTAAQARKRIGVMEVLSKALLRFVSKGPFR